MYLQGGKMSIFDLFKKDYTLADFSSNSSFAKMFADAAKKLAIPLKTVHLPKERHGEFEGVNLCLSGRMITSPGRRRLTKREK